MGEIEVEGNLTTHAKEGGVADSESGDIGDILPLDSFRLKSLSGPEEDVGFKVIDVVFSIDVEVSTEPRREFGLEIKSS